MSFLLKISLIAVNNNLIKKIVEKQICLDICFYYNPMDYLVLNILERVLNSLVS